MAAVAVERLGLHHVDADDLVLELTAAGEEPHPEHGWLWPVRRAVLRALQDHRVVSVEATGAWDSDWELADSLASEGLRVLRVLVWTTRATSLRRLAQRGAGRAPVTTEQAAWIYDAATTNFAGVRWDAVIDTSERQDSEVVVAALEPLLARGDETMPEFRSGRDPGDGPGDGD